MRRTPLTTTPRRQPTVSAAAAVYLHDIEEALLADSVLVFEQLVAGKRARNVSTDGLLKRRRLLQVAGVRQLLGTVNIHATQQLPRDAAERLRDSPPNQLLHQQHIPSSSSSVTTSHWLAALSLTHVYHHYTV